MQVDSLTGLYNRQAISREISRFLGSPPVRGQSCCLWIWMISNALMTPWDTEAGTMPCACVADLFRHTLRATDMVGRIGGDEFVALLTGISAKKEAWNAQNGSVGGGQHGRPQSWRTKAFMQHRRRRHMPLRGWNGLRHPCS